MKSIIGKIKGIDTEQIIAFETLNINKKTVELLTEVISQLDCFGPYAFNDAIERSLRISKALHTVDWEMHIFHMKNREPLKYKRLHTRRNRLKRGANKKRK